MTELAQELEGYIVPVKVTNNPEPAKKSKLRSTVKSYSIDPVNVPTALLAPYNPKRVMAHVTTNDTSCVISLDNPSNSPVTSTAGNAPPGNSIQLGTMGNGFDGYDIYGPDPIWAVAIVGNAVTRVNIVQTYESEE